MTALRHRWEGPELGPWTCANCRTVRRGELRSKYTGKLAAAFPKYSYTTVDGVEHEFSPPCVPPAPAQLDLFGAPPAGRRT